MLQLFRINDPYRLLGVAFVFMGICLPSFFFLNNPTLVEIKGFIVGEALLNGKTLYVEAIDDMAPIAAWLYAGTYWLGDRSITSLHIFACFLVFLQAVFFALLLISTKCYRENTYIPALVYVIIATFSFDMLSVSPELLASTVLLWVLKDIAKEIILKQQPKEHLINIGFFLGIASLIVFSYSFFLIGTIFILIVFTRIHLRKLWLLCWGYALPHVILFLFYYLHDNHYFLIDFFYIPNLSLQGEALVKTPFIILLLVVPFCYLILSLLTVNSENRFIKHQSDFFKLMLIWLLFAIVYLMISRTRTPLSIYPFLPPLSYFVSYYLLQIKRKWFAETMFWIFVIGAVTIYGLTKTTLVSNYAGLFPTKSEYGSSIKNKRILVLKKDNGIWAENLPAGFFLNWPLYKPIFEQPNLYKNITLIEKSFQKEAPEIIVDEANLMVPVFNRLPNWEKKYEKKGVLYYKINN